MSPLESFEDSSSPLTQIGKDMLFYLPAKIVPVMANFLGIAAYTRLLAPREYGWYALLTATFSFVHALAFGWAGYVIWRYFEKHKNDQNLTQFLSTVVVMLVVLFLVVAPLWYLITMFLSPYLETRLTSLLRVGILVLGAQVGFSMMLTILQVNRQSLKYSLYVSVNALGTLLLAVGLIYFLSLGVEGILWATVIFMGGISGLELSQFCKNWRISPFSFSVSLLGKQLAFGLPQIGISVGVLVLSMFDRYMIEAFRSTEEVGIYTAAYTVADKSIQIPLSIFTLAALPVIVQTFENKGEEETRLLFKRLFSLYLIILVPAVFGIAALSQDIGEVLLGQSFQSGSAVLPWVAGGAFFFGLSQYTNASFQLKEKPHLLLYLILMASLLNIMLNLALIAPMGILGAGYGTLITYFVYFAVSYVISERFFPLLFPWQAMSKSVLASIGMYLILQLGLINLTSKIQSLVLNIAIGALSYSTMLMILKEQTLWRILKRLNHRGNA